MKTLFEKVGKGVIYLFAIIGLMTQIPTILNTISKLLLGIAK